MKTLELEDTSIYYSPYRLKSASGLNAVSARRYFDGFLIKVGNGYGCVHPLLELGDPTVEKCLADLRGAQRWPIVKRALRCAEMDGAARELEDWMFDDIEIPESHATIVELKTDKIEEAVSREFKTIKLKVGRNAEKEIRFLQEMAQAFPALRWRLDMNEVFTSDQAIEFLVNIGNSFRSKVDFVEDPCPYSESLWTEIRKKTGYNLAVDREAAPSCSAAQVMVIKPAVDQPWLLTEAAVNRGQAVVMTSYMDHPLGQSLAAWEAMSMGVSFPGSIGMCGLQTHGLFEPNAFTEALGDVGPVFQAAEGTGLGFDELLKDLPWKRLD